MKGMRVFPPTAHKKLSQVLNGWVVAAEEHGFLQYKTSLLDSADLYLDKTSDEIMREQTYRFTDRGGRDVVLRPEITPGISNMIVDLQRERVLVSPYKVFSIGSVFRYENTQRGRSREHIQYNVDIFGEDGLWADAEVITLAFSALKHVGLRPDDFVVRLNDRSFVETTLTADLGLPETSIQDIFRILDKRDKMDKKAFSDAISSYGVTASALDDALRETPDRIGAIMDLLSSDELSVTYDPGIIRGFDYYTGIVFEIYAKDKKIAPRSIAGGGRYDSLIESYGGSPLPAVGFGMGDVALLDCLSTTDSVQPSSATMAIVYVSDMRSVARGVRASSQMRQHFPTSFIGTLSSAKQITDTYKYYDQCGVPFVIGLDDSSFVVRTLSTRTTNTFATIDEVIALIDEHVAQKNK